MEIVNDNELGVGSRVDVNNFLSCITNYLSNIRTEHDLNKWKSSLATFSLRILKSKFSNEANSAVDNRCIIQALWTIILWQQETSSLIEKTSGMWMEILKNIYRKLKVRKKKLINFIEKKE